MPSTSTTMLGVDFGAPQRARDQRRKIIAIAARPTDWRRYRIDATGMNGRLLAKDPPGWTATELLDELLANPVRIAAFDFPFCIPDALLRDEKFAADAGYKDGAFRGWRSFNGFVAQRLPLADPLEFRPFDAWRLRADRARLWIKRATDVAACGQIADRAVTAGGSASCGCSRVSATRSWMPPRASPSRRCSRAPRRSGYSYCPRRGARGRPQAQGRKGDAGRRGRLAGAPRPSRAASGCG
jgi:hypothetical protein